MMRPIPTDTVIRCGAIMTIAADQLRPMEALSCCYFQVSESVASGGSRCITPSG
jgi:hypothetical protein